MSGELVAFLYARLDEREQRARKAAARDGEHWTAGSEYVGSETTAYIAIGPWDGPLAETGEHIALNDPAWVLAEVAAKRREIEELLQLPHYAWDGRADYGCPKRTDPEVWAEVMGFGQVCDCGRDAHVDRMLRLRALPHVGHPDYLSEWAI
jgi:hypothetical protein